MEKVLEQVAKADIALEPMIGQILAVATHIKNDTVKTVVKKQIDQDALDVAMMLKDYVVERYPYYAKKINLEQWADDIRLMNAADGVSYEQIRAIVRYLFCLYSPDSRFDWREQIRSGASLRRQYIRLYELAKKDYDNFDIKTV